MSQQDIRALFLEEFIKRIIIRSMPRQRNLGKRDSMFSKLDKVASSAPALKIDTKFDETPPHLTPEFLKEDKFREEEKKIIPQQVKVEKFREVVVAKTDTVPAQNRTLYPRALEITPSLTPTMQKPSPPPQTMPGIPVLERLRPFIADPTVQIISCPGPDKNLLITRFGAPQQTNIILIAEEIKSFLKDISEKTRIPLLTGLFKVAYQNLVITAVVSEFVGTKFLIEKRTAVPLQLPMNPVQSARVQFR